MAKKLTNDMVLAICDKCQEEHVSEWEPKRQENGDYVAADPEEFCRLRQQNGGCELCKQIPELLGKKDFEKIQTCLECCLGQGLCILSNFFESEIGPGCKMCMKTGKVYASKSKRDEECEQRVVRIMRGEIKLKTAEE